MRAVFLDASTYGEDFDLSSLKSLPIQWTFYPTTTPDELKARIQQAEIIVTNKVKLNKETIAESKAKLICVTATGFDNIDIEEASKKGVVVSNIPSYSTPSVVQLTLTFILMLSESLLEYIEHVRRGEWAKSPIFTILDYPFFELQGKKLGIIGYGNIGREVARLAKGFGMEILIAQGSKENPDAVPLEEVLKESDFITLHIPLTDKTRDLIGEKELKMMKASSYLINVSRGGIVNEEALKDALKSKSIAGAAFDVLTKEPPEKDHPLLDPEIPNLILTPHIAWGSLESRMRSLEILEKNIQSFINGNPQNVIKPN